MPLPFFFIEDSFAAQGFITLNEDASRHIAQVLRMKAGERLELTDGRGHIVTAEITDGHKKKCVVKIEGTRHSVQSTRKVSIGISLLKNSNRFEWFLEKATEIGVAEIIPLLCERTEKQHFRFERMKNILVSAMLQSQQAWLPELKVPVPVRDIIKQSHHSQKFIAHCMEDAKIAMTDAINPATDSQLILIGPEGDFSKEEIDYSLQYHFIPVTLGETRLRTETAGIVAAAFLAGQ